MILKQIQK